MIELLSLHLFSKKNSVGGVCFYNVCELYSNSISFPLCITRDGFTKCFIKIYCMWRYNLLILLIFCSPIQRKFNFNDTSWFIACFCCANIWFQHRFLFQDTNNLHQPYHIEYSLKFVSMVSTLFSVYWQFWKYPLLTSEIWEQRPLRKKNQNM